MYTISDPITLSQKVLTDYMNCYGKHLVSFIVYGSAAGADFDPKSSDVNLLIVLDSITLQSLNTSLRIQSRWIKQRVSRPLFMDKEYIATSLDSFPVEFLNLKYNYKVIYGEDVLENIKINHEDVRVQVERELKGKWLHLMLEWLEVSNNTSLLSNLLKVSLKDFSAAFRGLLYIKQKPIPVDRKLLFVAITEFFGLKENYFEKTVKACECKNRLEMNAVFLSYTGAIKTLIKMIDQQKENHL
jgi:hypothetical protein